jgi:hypothetical protein
VVVVGRHRNRSSSFPDDSKVISLNQPLQSNIFAAVPGGVFGNAPLTSGVAAFSKANSRKWSMGTHFYRAARPSTGQTFPKSLSYPSHLKGFTIVDVYDLIVAHNDIRNGEPEG